MRNFLHVAAVWAVAAAALPLRAADLPAAERSILDGTNAYRREHGLAALASEPHLERAARDFADFMASRDAFGHQADGRTPVERARGAGYRDCMVAENIAQQFRTGSFETRELAERFVAGWEASPGHRRNMLDPEAVEVGIAIAHSAETSRFYAVQLFGRPESMRVAFEVRNESRAPVSYQVGDKEFTLQGRTEQRHIACGEVRVRFERRDGERTHKPATGDRYVITPEGALRLPARREER